MPDLMHQIPITASPAKVYAAITTQARLRGWWTADSTADENVGGEFCQPDASPKATPLSSLLSHGDLSTGGA